MRILITLLLMGGWANAQVSYSELVNKLKRGEDPAEIRHVIKTDGIAFDVDLQHLKMMKRDGFPDWLIDTLVMVHNRAPMKGAPQRYAMDDAYHAYNAYDDYHARRLSTYLFWDWALGVPFWYNGIWSPYYATYANPYIWSSWYWPYYGGYYGGSYWVDGVYLPGNRLTRDGYRNRVDDRSVGHARVKGSNKSSSSSSARSSRSSSSRASSASRSSSSGGKVTSRGYSKRH